MNKWIGQLLFVIITTLTVGIAWYQYQLSLKETKEAQRKDLIFPEWHNQVADKIYIRYNKKIIQLVRGKYSLWRLLSPLKDLADGSVVSKWLDQVFREKAKILNKNLNDWSEYGLSSTDQTREIRITNQSKINFGLLISHYSAFDGRFFLKKIIDQTSDNHLLLGSTTWANITQKPADYFRSYKLLNILEQPNVLHYQSKKIKVKLKRTHNTWEWEQTANKQFPLSQSELEAYIIDLTTAQFKKSNIYPNTLTNRKKYQLFKPAIQIYLKFNKKVPEENNSLVNFWEAKFFKKKNQYYVLVSTRNYIFTLKTDDHKKVLLTEKRIKQPPIEPPKKSPKDTIKKTNIKKSK